MVGQSLIHLRFRNSTKYYRLLLTDDETFRWAPER